MLELDTSKEKDSGKKTKSQKLLNDYLSNVVSKTFEKSFGSAERIVKKNLKHEMPEYYLNNINMKDVDVKQKEIKDALKQYGTKAKINYSTDSLVIQELFGRQKKALAITAASIASALVAGAAMSAHALISKVDEKTATAVVGCYAASLALKFVGAYASRAKTENEKREFADFADLKHAEFGLKKLKKAICINQKEQAQPKKATMHTIMQKEGGR